MNAYSDTPIVGPMLDALQGLPPGLALCVLVLAILAIAWSAWMAASKLVDFLAFMINPPRGRYHYVPTSLRKDRK